MLTGDKWASSGIYKELSVPHMYGAGEGASAWLVASRSGRPVTIVWNIRPREELLLVSSALSSLGRDLTNLCLLIFDTLATAYTAGMDILISEVALAWSPPLGQLWEPTGHDPGRV